MVRLTDGLDMTIAVDWDIKNTQQTNKTNDHMTLVWMIGRHRSRKGSHMVFVWIHCMDILIECK